MATVPVIKTIFSGNNILKLNVTGVFNTANATNFVIVDRSALTGPDGINPPSSIKIEEITFSIGVGFDSVDLSWDLATDEIIERLSNQGYFDFRSAGGKVMGSAASTATEGDILLTTLGGAAALDTFSIYLDLRLKV